MLGGGRLTFAVGVAGLKKARDHRPNVTTLRDVSSARGAEAEPDHQLVHQERDIRHSKRFVQGALSGKGVPRHARDDDVEGGRGRGDEDGDNVEELNE